MSLNSRIKYASIAQLLYISNFLPIGLILYGPIKGKIFGLLALPIITSINLMLSPIHIYEYAMYGNCFKYDPNCPK